MTTGGCSRCGESQCTGCYVGGPAHKWSGRERQGVHDPAPDVDITGAAADHLDALLGRPDETCSECGIKTVRNPKTGDVLFGCGGHVVVTPPAREDRP